MKVCAWSAPRGMGEGTRREPGRARPSALLHPAAAVQELRRDERLADRQMHRLRQGASPPRTDRADDLAGVRAEGGKLVPYAGRFDGFHAVPASVSKTCLVRFDTNALALGETHRL